MRATKGWRRPLTAVLGAVMVATLLGTGAGATPPSAVAGVPSKPRDVPSVPGRAATVLPRTPDAASAAALRGPGRPAVAWPAAGAAELPVGAAGKTGAGQPGAVRVGQLPVAVAAASSKTAVAAGAESSVAVPPATDAPTRVRLQVLDRAAAVKAGVDGVLLRLRRADGKTGAGPVSVSVDYSGFRDAYGGDWASRLRLVWLDGKQRTALASRNDLGAGRVSAVVTAGAADTTLAVEAAPSGSAGDYTATSLSPSGTWQVAASSGTFTWSYKLRVPPVPGGLPPELAATYSSAGADGQVVSTNNQPSWVGEGWQLWPGFVERSYKACADDMDGPGHNNSEKTGDLCWETENATLSLGGASTELVLGADNVWRPQQDDGSRVEHLFGVPGGNGDNDNEYWKVTTTDGVRYYFGRHTDSAWNVPVFGNDPGEPCFVSGNFAASHCVQAYRWNLDYVVDPHGNSISYSYSTESNRYGLNLGRETASYTRGGTLASVEYGTRDGQSGTPPAKVVFGTADRCVPGADCTAHTAASWPDVPWDRDCAAAPCTNKFTPTFWSTKRLDTVTTYAGGTPVDSWSFDQSYPAPGDGTSASLWLHGITHTGLVGTSTAVPPVSFDGTAYPNRVDSSTDGLPALNKFRVHAINTESGGQISIKYADPDCTPSNKPEPDSNALRCYPVRWTMPPEVNPRDDWFHKYVVAEVSQVDRVGAGLRQLTTYAYLGPAAWHYHDDQLVPPARRTWSEWRGYEKVIVRKGDPAAEPGRPQSETLQQYFRGMNGDRTAAGGAKSASITDSAGVSLPDENPYAGFLREEITDNGAGGPVVSGVIHDPWKRGPTATQGSLQAFQVEDVRDVMRTALAAGGFRRTEVDTAYDNEGNPTRVNDRGDLSVDTDDRCTRTTYARNTGSWLLTLPSRVETVGVACTATPSFPDDAISDVRTYYDGGGLGDPPSAGNPTRTEKVASYSGGTPSYVQASRATYDAYGRVLDAFDALDRKTSTSYTDSGGLNTATTVTNPLGHTATTSFQPASGVPVAAVDANQRRTDLTYDGLARLTGVWKPGRSKADGDGPTARYTYTVRDDGPSWIKTDTLNASESYTTSYTLLDGFLRQRQTQGPSEQGGRVLTDTQYDSRGLTYKTYQAYYNDAAGPGMALLLPDENKVPNQTLVRFDGAERPVVSMFLKLNQEQLDWRTTTAYGGDHVDVTPPKGATATTTWADARGQTTELWQYRAATPTGAHDLTRYGYTKAGLLATMTDPAGNTWRYGYDVRGRKTRVDDPDKGLATMTYDDADQLLTTTDARGQTIANVYDALGRKVETHRDSAGGPLLARWVYDTLAGGRGALASSTRYQSGNAYTRAVTGYDPAGQPRGEDVTIPAVEQGLAGVYSTSTTYRADGSPASVSQPALGNLPAETLVFDYDDLGLPLTLQGASTYVADTKYTALNEPTQVEQGAVGKRVWQTSYYEEGTRRVAEVLTEREQAGAAQLDDLSYAYDPAGNLLKIRDAQPGTAVDAQCFNYDHLRRITQAWTQTGDCAATPATSLVGGPAPYWQSFTYDLTGNRASQTRHGLGGATDSVSTYSYPAGGSPRPHAVGSVQTTGPGAGTQTYDYDAVGNTTSRPGPTGTAQAMTWDPEGLLSSAGDASYVYDADGKQLLRRDPGSVTLFVGGGELRLDTATGARTGTRYYRGAAIRTSAGLSWLVNDQHGTAQVAVNATSLAATSRRFDLFGNQRGGTAAAAVAGWPGGERGFVGGTANPATGLTRLGAREYDPKLGKFLSADPLLDPKDPQQFNAYAYANNNPVTMSDPDGKKVIQDDWGPGQYYTQPGSAPASTSGNGSCGSGCTQKTLPHGTKLVTVHTSKGDLHYLNGMFLSPNLVHKPERFAQLFDDYYANEFHSKQAGNKQLRTVASMSDACETEEGVCTDAFASELSAIQAKIAAEIKGNCHDYCERFSDFLVTIAGSGLMAAARPSSLGFTGLTAALDRSLIDDLLCLHSFRADTLVLMADGSTRPISEVRVGDKVKATDPGTGETVVRTVTAVHHNRDTDLVDLTVRDARGRMVVLHTTRHHPLWDDRQGRWVEAGSLRPGGRLHSPTGAAATVVKVRSFAGRAGMYDLTVEGIHTYHVMAGATPVLVHNCGGTATVRWDNSIGHAQITVTNSKGQSLTTNQAIPQGVGNPTTGAVAEQMSGSRVISRTFDLPDADAAMAAQKATIGADLGAYDLYDNSCATYCVGILRAGGFDIPAGSEGQRWLLRQMR